MSHNGSPYTELRPYLPPTWSTSTQLHKTNLFVVPKGSGEHKEVMRHFSHEADQVFRHQNINQYGMFLIRQQHLQVLYPNVNHVKVTRYCKLQRTSIDEAVKCNLDERRIQETITFTMAPPKQAFHNEIILVVSCITREDNFGTSNLKPERDNDFYIEYAVNF